MSSFTALREPVRSIALPPNIPAAAVLGQRGKLINRVRQLTGAALTYRPEDHRVDINGSPQDVGAAARLLDRTLEHYQYSGLQFTRKQIFNVLRPQLSDAEVLRLQSFSRPVSTLLGPVDGFVLCPEDGAAATGNQQPGASTSTAASDLELAADGGGSEASASASPPLLRLSGDLDACLQQLVDLAAEISVRHPANCDHTEIRLYLGKLVLTDVVSSTRRLSPRALASWSFQRHARTVFETSLPQETIRSLDRYLTSKGLNPTQQSKSASLHLESSINWIQYHPTFTVGPAGELRLAKLETLGCKPLTVALVGPHNCTDVRLRYVASVQHGEEDPVAAELRRRQGEFALVNSVQVVVPDDLDAMDLTLTSARVKLKRVYTSPGPLPPPPPPSSPSPTTAVRRSRTTKRAASAASALPPESHGSGGGNLPPVSLKVSVAAVVDNSGGKRLEVTVGCPELNATLMGLHRARREADGSRQLLAAQLRSLLAHMEELQRNVEFEP